MKKALYTVLAMGTVLLGLNMEARAASTADIVFLVDESGSMSGEHSWLNSMVTDLESALVTAGVTNNRYSLVGYGNNFNPGIAGRNFFVGGGANTWGTAAQLATKTGSLVTNGGTEDGYAAINFTQPFSFRAEAAVNYILITDEDRDNTNNALTYNSILNQLNGDGALLNVVVDGTFKDNNNNRSIIGVDSKGNWYKADGSGGYTEGPGGMFVSGSGSTYADYIQMAWATGAAAWDLNILRAGGLLAESFTNAFIDIKVQEIIITPPGKVPEPATMLLFGTGLAGLAAFGRRKVQK